MYVCICHSVTDKAIEKAVGQGHNTLEAIQQELKASTCCGRCKNHVCEVIEQTARDTGHGLLDFINREVTFA